MTPHPTDTPLHVKVAEALGWTDTVLQGRPFGREPHWRGVPPDGIVAGDGRLVVPDYDSSWSATGPLLERHANEVSKFDGVWACVTGDAIGRGASLLEAACHLILALAAAGKLPRT